MLEHHLQLSDREFEQAFANAELPPALFTHESHLRLAWIHVQQLGLEGAIEIVCEQLKNYTRVHAAEQKYHHTLTVAALRMVWHFYQQMPDAEFPRFIETFPRLKTQFKELLFTHYSPELVQNPQAREVWMEPDLLPFT